VLAPGAIA
jgi:hypothetical protein